MEVTQGSVKSESPSATRGSFPACGTAGHLSSRMEQHRPAAPQGTLPTTF